MPALRGRTVARKNAFFKFETKLLHLRHRTWKEFGELRESEKIFRILEKMKNGGRSL